MAVKHFSHTWKMAKYFYPNSAKQIPQDLEKILTEPISLAIWYMDDGYYSLKDKSSYIYLGRVSKNEALIAQKAIENNFDIKSKVYDKKKKVSPYSFLFQKQKTSFKIDGTYASINEL